MKVNIYIWRRKLITKPGPPPIKYGAELCWPTGSQDEWYEGYWTYTPLFDTEEAAENAANKLAKLIEKSELYDVR